LHGKNRATTNKNLNEWRIRMGKLGALAVLLTVAAVIYLLSPDSQVLVAKEQQTVVQSKTLENEQVKEAHSKNSQSPLMHSIDSHSDSKDSDSNEKIEIPQYIKDSLEAKRIPASELVEQRRSDGSVTMDLKGQYQHMPVAVIGKDGKVRIIEQTIKPIANQ
jgi:hypothetical protein